MKLLNTYEDKEEAEKALVKIIGVKRLASERDGNVIIYNLFGQATWGNFYKLELFNLIELKEILLSRQDPIHYDYERHMTILSTLKYVCTMYELEIPKHWL